MPEPLACPDCGVVARRKPDKSPGWLFPCTCDYYENQSYHGFRAIGIDHKTLPCPQCHAAGCKIDDGWVFDCGHFRGRKVPYFHLLHEVIKAQCEAKADRMGWIDNGE